MMMGALLALGRLSWPAEMNIFKMFDVNVAKNEQTKMAILLLCIAKAQPVVFDNYLEENR